jgi:hypothetical protein
LKSLCDTVFTVKSSNKILFVEIQVAKNPSRSIGMRLSVTSIEFDFFLYL